MLAAPGEKFAPTRPADQATKLTNSRPRTSGANESTNTNNGGGGRAQCELAIIMMEAG